MRSNHFWERIYVLAKVYDRAAAIDLEKCHTLFVLEKLGETTILRSPAENTSTYHDSSSAHVLDKPNSITLWRIKMLINFTVILDKASFFHSPDIFDFISSSFCIESNIITVIFNFAIIGKNYIVVNIHFLPSKLSWS